MFGIGGIMRSKSVSYADYGIVSPQGHYYLFNDTIHATPFYFWGRRERLYYNAE